MTKDWKKYVASALTVAVIGLGVSSCMKGDQDDPAARWQQEVNTIDNYLAGKFLPAVKDPSGIRMVIDKLGKGFPAKGTSTIDVDYSGRLFPDGAQFDAGNVTGVLSGYIQGWQYALAALPEGSKATIFIPSALGYGRTGSGSIPGDAILQFDIDFKQIKRTSAELARLGTDSVAIDNYLLEKEIDAVQDTAGIRYVVTQPASGGGLMPTLYNKLKFKTAYRLLTDDSKVVADIAWEPAEGYDSRAVDQLADGIKRVLTKMQTGSKVRAYLPSLMAFGTIGASTNGEVVVPANANVIVDIELVEIVTQ